MYAEGPLWGGAKKLDKISNCKRSGGWIHVSMTCLILPVTRSIGCQIGKMRVSQCSSLAIRVLALVEEQPDEETDIPLFVDAASSGTQLFSHQQVIIRWSLCNLTPNEEPSNIYQVGADLARVPLMTISRPEGDKKQHAEMWLSIDALNVKTSKRNLMTAGYDSKASGWLTSFMKMSSPLRCVSYKEITDHPFPNRQRAAARYLADINFAMIPSYALTNAGLVLSEGCTTLPERMSRNIGG